MGTNVIDIITKALAAIGGAGVILAGVSKIAGTIWEVYLKERQRRRTERALEFERQLLGLSRVRADKYADAQFDVYHRLWKALNDLRIAGNALWSVKGVNVENIDLFEHLLGEATSLVDENAIFFEEQDYQELREILRAFRAFYRGKAEIVRMQDALDRGSVNDAILINTEFPKRVERNRQYKNRYEELLERIRISFRRRLSTLGIET